MSALKFGTSWLGVIFNPVGYMAQRKSPSEAAAQYAMDNPTSFLITADDSEISFKEDARSWIDGCAAKLKSDDVGKSKANSQKACEGAFYADANVISVQSELSRQAEAEQVQIKQSLSTALVLIGIAAFVLLIIYLLKSK